MYCPKCNHTETKVTDTRMAKDNRLIRRRRQCLQCGHRFSTVETMLREDLVVVKRDGRREEFSRAKLLAGLRTATEKRPIDTDKIEVIVSGIIEELEERFDTEIPSGVIGEVVMEQLKNVDQIAYVRFASVYKDFRDLSEMAQEISALSTPPK